MASSKLSVSMTGGQLTPKGDGHYIAHPTNVGGEAVFTVVAQNEGRKYNPTNFLLMHSMGPNVAGVIGSAVAAGFLLIMFG